MVLFCGTLVGDGGCGRKPPASSAVGIYRSMRRDAVMETLRLEGDGKFTQEITSRTGQKFDGKGTWRQQQGRVTLEGFLELSDGQVAPATNVFREIHHVGCDALLREDRTHTNVHDFIRWGEN